MEEELRISSMIKDLKKKMVLSCQGSVNAKGTSMRSMHDNNINKKKNNANNKLISK